MFNYFKKNAISNRANDTVLYEYVMSEIENNFKIKGLWAKAYANSNGNDNKIEPLYMQFRVQSIKDKFTAIDIAYQELSRKKLFEFIGNGFKDSSKNYIAEDKISIKEEIVNNSSIKEKTKELDKSAIKEDEWTVSEYLLN